MIARNHIVVTLINSLRHSALDAESHEIAGQARNDAGLFSIETAIILISGGFSMMMRKNLKILFCAALIILSAISPAFNFPVNAAAISKTKKDYVVFTEKNIKTEDLRKKSKLDETKLSEYMKKFPNLAGIEETLIEVQDDYKVNAILILAIIRLESGNGKSQIAKNKNNLGGIVAPSKSVTAYRSFDTKSDCVIYMAKLLSEHYLTEGGKYHNGYTLPDIAKRYSAASDKWTDLVAELIYEIQTGIDKIK